MIWARTRYNLFEWEEPSELNLPVRSFCGRKIVDPEGLGYFVSIMLCLRLFLRATRLLKAHRSHEFSRVGYDTRTPACAEQALRTSFASRPIRSTSLLYGPRISSGAGVGRRRPLADPLPPWPSPPGDLRGRCRLPTCRW